jgi:hypothetical protein
MLKCQTCECEITGQFYYRSESLLDGVLCLACAVPIEKVGSNA